MQAYVGLAVTWAGSSVAVQVLLVLGAAVVGTGAAVVGAAGASVVATVGVGSVDVT